MNVIDLSRERDALALDLPASLLDYLEKGNRMLFRLRGLEQLPAVALLAYDNSLAFEFDRTAEGVSVLVFNRGTKPQKGYGDNGTGI